MNEYTYTDEFDPNEEAYIRSHEERYYYLSIYDNHELNEYVRDDIERLREITDENLKNQEIKALKRKIFEFTNIPEDHEFLIDDYINGSICQ